MHPMNRETRIRLRHIRHFHVRHTGEYVLRGVLVLAPLLITISLLVWFFHKLDNLLNPYVTTPGAGFALVFVLIVLVGWISSFLIMRRTFGIIDRGLEHLPGVSFIYTSVRDFLEAFVGNKRRFNQAVLVNLLPDVWLVGFLTDEAAGNFDLGEEYVSVYVPQAYNVAGQLYLVKRDRVKPIENRSPAEVMKYAVIGGAIESADKET
jgi:uncharacterized membrane protein